MATRTGDAAANRLEGGSFEDSLSGAGGNDTLEGYGGNDTLNGDAGNDELWGGAGNDTLYGGDGNDLLRADTDTSGAVNWLDGGKGNDRLWGSAGNDTLIGGQGDDSLDAGGGVDLLQGGDGNDRLSTSLGGRFRLEGGNGNDTFSASNLAHSSVVDLKGGAGSDTFIATYERPNADRSDSLIRCHDFKAGPGGDRIDLGSVFPLMTGLVGIDDPFDLRLGYLRLVQQGADTALQLDADGLIGEDHPWHTLLLLKGVTASALTLADNVTGTTNVGALSVVQGTGAAPTVAKLIPELPAKPGASISYKVPNGSFADADVGDPMQLSATLAGGGALPAWLMFDIRSQTFTGTLPAGNPQLPVLIQVTATDAAGLSVSDVFAITPATPGSDSLRGAAGNDVYDGLAGDDTIDGSLGNDSIEGNVGDDRLLGDVGRDTLAGGEGSDTLLGGDGNDSLAGGGNSDSLDGGSGNDTMTGGTGNDRYVVQSSGDKVVEAAGGGSNDVVTTLVSHTLASEVEALVLSGSSNLGGTGNALPNTLTGNSGHNGLSGGDGHDTLVGGTGNDTLSGGAGNDTLDGGAGYDSMIGGAGNDHYAVDVAADQVTEAAGGGTADQVTSLVTYTLGAEVEHLVLDGSSDLSGTGNKLSNGIAGNIGHNSLTGGDGNDTLLGGAGNDTLSAGNGDDRLDGGTGNDTMTGGAGNDIYSVSIAADKVVEAAGGGTADQVNSLVTCTLGAELEHLVLEGTSNLGGTGNAVPNRITGNAANNIMNGLDGSDTLTGGAGNDTLRGGHGNDSLNGGAGNDSLDGGAGNDRYAVDSSTDKVVELAGGGTDGVSSTISYTLPMFVEKLTLTGSGTINGTGNAASNTITGNGKANLLAGADGNDGLNGADGNDTLSGGAGNDRLDGGAGNDRLTGGAGGDIFRFGSAINASTNVDTLVDVNPADDILQLENGIFTKLAATGVLSSSYFRASTSGNATDSNDHVLYETDTGRLYYDADGSGAGVKVLIATLTGQPALTSADIFVT